MIASLSICSLEEANQQKRLGDEHWSVFFNIWKTSLIGKRRMQYALASMWAYLLGLDVSDPGFDFTVLVPRSALVC